ncbi:MAG: hypothetical protein LBK54_01640 [Propionibacteriaceae bacterium]|jgi:hypothetical protein|nr:hypothetical protein [Propionibacteriaceae bacterium]
MSLFWNGVDVADAMKDARDSLARIVSDLADALALLEADEGLSDSRPIDLVESALSAARIGLDETIANCQAVSES